MSNMFSTIAAVISLACGVASIACAVVTWLYRKKQEKTYKTT